MVPQLAMATGTHPLGEAKGSNLPDDDDEKHCTPRPRSSPTLDQLPRSFSDIVYTCSYTKRCSNTSTNLEI